MSMDLSNDSQVLHTALDWLEASDVVFLITVTETWGSSPRRPGSLMVLHPDGRFAGSVSGGCVEDDLQQRVMRGEFDSGLPKFDSYGVGEEQMQKIGLPCGGRLSLFIECIEDPGPLREILEAISSRRRIARHVCLETGISRLQPTNQDSDLELDGTVLIKFFGPKWRLIIIGAGELTRRVAQLALTLDYAVTICDSRPEYVEDWHVAETGFVSLPTADAITQLEPDDRTAVLALSHTRQLDDPALAVALKSEAYYIGALGSKSNQNARCRRMKKLGFTADELDRLQGPIGLAIGSRTPAEIAVSIIAALIQQRNRITQTCTASV
jgi:xanthine dehydrogenase accessory factor